STRPARHARKGSGLPPLLPRGDDRLDVLMQGYSRVHLEVIHAVAVGVVEVRACLAEPSVATLAFPPLEFRQRAMEPNEEHVEPTEQAQELLHPGAGLDDVFDHEIVAGRGERGQAMV